MGHHHMAMEPAESIGQQRLLLQLCDSAAAAQEMKFSTVAIIDSLFTVACCTIHYFHIKT